MAQNWRDRIVADHRIPEQWIKARDGKIGASDAAAFAKEESIDSYVAKKLAPPWEGSEFSTWGNTREPIILQDHGYQQNHFMIRSVENPRFVATPDAIRGNRLSQVKTSIKPFISKRTLEVLVPPNYKRQCQWEMVAGEEFIETDVIYDKYDKVGEEFRPEFQATVIKIVRDEVEIAKLIRIAEKVLHGLDLAQF
jgi:hypothetical protein